MASAVTLDVMKGHLRISSGNAEDIQLAGYLGAAKAHMNAYLRRDLDVDFPDGWPEDIDQAVRLLVAHWYLNRSSVSVGAAAVSLPMGVQDLLEAHRNLS